MIKLISIIKENNFNPGDWEEFSSKDQPDHYNEKPNYSGNDNNAIEAYVDSIEKKFPNGVKALQIFHSLPDEDAKTHLKILIELSKRKLLNFGIPGEPGGETKITPDIVLKIYGHPHHTATNAKFSKNEGINAVNSMEDPSFHPSEVGAIEKFVDQVEQKRPQGITADEVYSNTPNLNPAQRIKLLIALAQRRLLVFGGIKLNPSSVLKIYANDSRNLAKSVVDDRANMNEIKNVAPNKLWEEFKRKFNEWVAETNHTWEQLGWGEEEKIFKSSATPQEFMKQTDSHGNDVLEAISFTWQDWSKNPSIPVAEVASNYFPDEDNYNDNDENED